MLQSQHTVTGGSKFARQSMRSFIFINEKYIVSYREKLQNKNENMTNYLQKSNKV